MQGAVTTRWLSQQVVPLQDILVIRSVLLLVMLMAIRFIHQGWMIHQQEHLNGVPPIHFRYLDLVHIRYVMSISTEVDEMVGSLTLCRFLVIIRGLLRLLTIPSSPEMFGMALICARMPLLRFSNEFQNGLCSWFFPFLLVSYSNTRRVTSSTLVVAGTFASNLSSPACCRRLGKILALEMFISIVLIWCEVVINWLLSLWVDSHWFKNNCQCRLDHKQNSLKTI